MKGLELTLRALHHGERSLADDLLRVAERHGAEHEVRHIATDLARWSQEHTRRLADIAGHYGLDLSGPRSRPPGLVATLREKAGEAVGRRPEPALLLLHDLRELHLSAAGNSLYWEMLAQAAQASRDRRLLELAADCHPQTLRQMRWTDTLVKQLSAQALTSV
ncbi:hypothetical protein VSR01_04345 [Actinacidiphila sp. DG2A-62]|uniref:hypothetical protein n=1 Tax=Actinacidiphila sp. DG2A-62 TaxID=3108821 RepID=UPI002DB87449|nr:hypothetical protein [Actinacidiphila sp. DG2A-62]MEC3992816.1 hypothetical protein [Actinacidiphila sp. DG2A-62]